MEDTYPFDEVFILAHEYEPNQTPIPMFYRIEPTKIAIIYWESYKEASQFAATVPIVSSMVPIKLTLSLFNKISELLRESMTVSLLTLMNYKSIPYKQKIG